MSEINNWVQFYFLLGLQQKEIILSLQVIHNISISERSLRRKLRVLNLFRRKNYSDVLHVSSFVEENLQTHGQLHGYKWLHLKCIQNNFVVTQEVIRMLLTILDPEGVELRRRRRLRRRQYRNRGPNYLWHIDCYDKLKPFGICISGCIDGFSRKLIWLRAGKNTNDPRVIAGYYIQSVESLGGFPLSIRADNGTENGTVADIQKYFTETYTRLDANSRLPPFLYGSSPSNQRIEAWWSMQRKHHSQFWLNVFHKLKEDNMFSGSFLDKNLIQFCFLQIIQKELDIVIQEWDMHLIQSSKNSVSPRGRPFLMFHIPQLYETVDYITQISENDLLLPREACIFSDNIPCDVDVYELAMEIMNEMGLSQPTLPNDAIDFYIVLRNEILKLI